MQIEFNATKRTLQGTGASRRLRVAGSVPAIIYGAGQEALAVTLDHNQIYHLLNKEAFHSSLLTANVEGKKETVILRDVQWHAYRPLVLHLDLQRVDPKAKLHIKVPLHFINADICPGVKLHGGIVSHVTTEIEVSCLPADLPEFIEVDLQMLDEGASLPVSSLKLPKGVSVAAHGDDDAVVATVMKIRGGAAEDEGTAAAAPSQEA